MRRIENARSIAADPFSPEDFWRVRGDAVGLPLALAVSGKRNTDSSQGGTKAQKAAAGRKGGKAAAKS